MMRINKLTDYGIVVMTRIADMDQTRVHTAREISEDTRIPLPTVTRLLKTLSGNGLLDSQRGSQGGYSLSRSSDGPIALTECSMNTCKCVYETKCSVEEPWQKINDTVKNALEGISLNQMAGKNQNEGLLNLSMNYSGGM